MEHILVFIASFTQVGLISINTLNIVRVNVLAAFFTSWGITLSWAFGVVHIVQDPTEYIWAYGLGAALGISTVTHFGEKFRKK